MPLAYPPAGADRVKARRQVWFGVIVGLGLIAQWLTIASPAYVPLVDLPNHMARHVLEADWLQGRALPSFYSIEYRVVPNLGGDLVMPLLLLVLEPGAACKLFLMLAATLYWLGPALYILTANDYKDSSMFAALLLLPLSFSSQFFWGFLNYYSGFGLAFLALTHWQRLLAPGKARAWEWAAHAVLVAILFIWHLAAWGIYGLIAVSHLLAKLSAQRRAGFAALALPTIAFVLVCLPSLLMFAIYILEKSGGGLGETHYGPLVRKLYMPLTLFRGYDLATDGVVIFLWLAALGLLFVGSSIRFKASVHLVSIVLLCLLYIAIPFQLGGTSDTDSRLLPALLVCALAWLGAAPMRRVCWGVACLALCLAVRQGAIYAHWRVLTRRLEVHARAFEHLTPQSRLLPLVLVPEGSKAYPERSFFCWAVVSHRALVPTLFARRDQQPLRMKVSVGSPVRWTEGRWEFDEAKVREAFDFVWIANLTNESVVVPARFERVFAAEELELWRVR